MREVRLSQNLVALVDDGDYDLVQAYKWHPCKRDTVYAHASVSGVTVSMHRLVLGLEFGDKRQGDHIDGNGLNNQRSNLRITTSGQNQMNRKSARESSSQYLGVVWIESRSKWRARIRHDGDAHYLGDFVDEVEAAAAYDIAARQLHGEYARLNLI